MVGIERRNAAFPPSFLLTPNATAWNWAKTPKIPVEKAVADGLKACGWVYRAVTIISRNAAAVPWGLYHNDSGEFDYQHPLSKLLANPCPDLSRLDLFIMLQQWQQLTGEAYLWKNMIGSETRELWPVSPERLRPIPSARHDMLLTGYNERGPGGWFDHMSQVYTRDSVVPFRFIDPADPLRGIAPLESAARSVDIDVEQQKFNAAAMSNRGVLDTVISYKEALTQDQYDAVKEQIRSRIAGASNAREPYVTGGGATVQRLGLTPVEMDFLAGRKWNMTEIFAIFGVPVQLGAAVDAMTYDNYSISRRVLWEMTILPILDDHRDTLNRAFHSEIPDGFSLHYDTRGITALKEDDERVAKVAKLYFDMGVPVAIINEKLGLGVATYPGDSLPWGGSKPPAQAQTANREAPSFRIVEARDLKAEAKVRDRWAEGPAFEMYEKLLSDQKADVFALVDAGRSQTEIEQFIRDADGWIEPMEAMGAAIAIDFGDKITVTREGKPVAMEYRDEFTDAFEAQLAQYFEREKWMLTELSLLSETTVTLVMEQVSEGIKNGWTVQEIKTALEDVGAFSPQRALMLARTLAGTSASIGQLSSAMVSGSTHKTWMTSGFGVRAIHTAREGETVAIDSTFSARGKSGVAPRFPLDPFISPDDRISCRCSMTFSG
jgi:HK97 family phage portal protein